MRRNRSGRMSWIAILASLMFCSAAFAEQIEVGRFSSNDLSGWEEKSFVDHTRYSLIENSGKTVLKAQANGAASGMFRKIHVDLNKTPYLNWSWKIDNIYQGNNERSKQGDDYPARVYVVVSGGLFFWRTRAINYVWSSNQAVGTTWNNAYTGNAKMLAVRSGSQAIGQWLTEKRNIRDDLQTLFGEEIDEIDAVAIMTDSDNTKQSATAYYGDIFLSSD